MASSSAGGGGAGPRDRRISQTKTPQPEAIVVDIPGLMCFGCSPRNQYGLQLRFFRLGQQVYTEFTPTEFLQGWFSAVHGGVLSALVDELAVFTVAGLQRRIGVSRSLNVQFKRPLYVGDPISLLGTVVSSKRNLAEVHCELSNHRGDLCCEGEASVYLLERAQFEKMIPGGKIPASLDMYFPPM